MLLSELAPLVNAQQGAVYQMRRAEAGSGRPTLTLLAGYATPDDQSVTITVGARLVGQCALEKQPILLNKVPRTYAQIRSSLGSSRPAAVVVLPVLFEGETKAVIELASSAPFAPPHL